MKQISIDTYLTFIAPFAVAVSTRPYLYVLYNEGRRYFVQGYVHVGGLLGQFKQRAHAKLEVNLHSVALNRAQTDSQFFGNYFIDLARQGQS